MQIQKNSAKISKIVAKYEGLADFFLRAPQAEQLEVIKDAARKANDDQRRMMVEWVGEKTLKKKTKT